LGNYEMIRKFCDAKKKSKDRFQIIEDIDKFGKYKAMITPF